MKNWLTQVREVLPAALPLLTLSMSPALPGSESAPEGQLPALAARTAAYFDPNRAGEGIFVEILDAERALVYLASFGPKVTAAQEESEPSQVWMIGLGRQTDWGIEVDEMLMPSGGGFAGQFNPDLVEYKSIGSLTFVYPDCAERSASGQLLVTPSESAKSDFQSMETSNYAQLTQTIDCVTGERGVGTFRTGSWFDPAKPGEGIIVQGFADGRGLVQWMTFSPTGAQLWVQGVGNFDEYGRVLVIDELATYGGTFWGSDFDPADVGETPFGSATLTFIGCEWVLLEYSTIDFGAGILELQALTYPHNEVGQGCWDY